MAKKYLPESHRFKCKRCSRTKIVRPVRWAKQLKRVYCSTRCSALAIQTIGVEAAKSPEGRENNRLAKRALRPSRGYVKYYGRHEHRIIAEKMMGRKLRHGEIVHHKNHNKSDNRPENLEVMTQSEHCKAHDFGHHPGARRGNP